MSQKYTLLTFKGIGMNFLLKLNSFILSHPVTSKQPHKIIQKQMRHPVCFSLFRLQKLYLDWKIGSFLTFMLIKFCSTARNGPICPETKRYD